MLRTPVVLLLGAAICSAGLRADDKIKGGIEGKIKSVDVSSKTLTIVTAQGRERTFSVTDDSTLLGPRGGKVRRHLKDPRFREGFPVTVVAEGNAASEVHLGYAPDADDAKKTKDDRAQPKVVKKSTKPVTETEPADQPTEKTVAKSRTSRYSPPEDEDNEVPGTIKSFNPSKRVLVVSLLNGNDRSFMLSKDVKVLVKGKASTHGLQEPSLKAGAKITVTTEADGRRVKELEIVPVSSSRLKKAS